MTIESTLPPSEVTAEKFESAQQEVTDILDLLLSRITTPSAGGYLKIFLYGMPGVGKTTFIASAPKPIIIDVERGTTVLAGSPDYRETAVLQFKSFFQMEQLLNAFAAGDPRLDKFETICVDSFSEMQKRDLDDIVRNAAANDSSRNKYLPIGEDYNINTEHMRQIADQLRNLDRHIIATAHVKEEKNGDTGRILVRPNLTPKLSTTIAGIFDMICYLSRSGEGENVVRSLQVDPTASVTAKTRIKGLPSTIENPTFDVILSAYTNSTKG